MCTGKRCFVNASRKKLSKYNRFFSPTAVLYEDSQKQALVDSAIEMALICFKNQARFSEEIAISVASEFLSDLIFKVNPLLKHRGFEAEAECRFVDNDIKQTDTEKCHIYYRNRGGIVLPYVKYKLRIISY